MPRKSLLTFFGTKLLTARQLSVSELKFKIKRIGFSLFFSPENLELFDTFGNVVGFLDTINNKLELLLVYEIAH